MDARIKTTKVKKPQAHHQGWAWVSLCLTFAAHVIDETLTDFLSVYNPAVLSIRQQLPFLPLPIFSFKIWLSGLILAVILLLLLTPYSFRRTRWIRVPSYLYGIIMLLNGLGHIAGSFYLGRLMPGVYSSPLLLASSIYLLWAVYQSKKETAAS
jgi:hypothetical protein